MLGFWDTIISGCLDDSDGAGLKSALEDAARHKAVLSPETLSKIASAIGEKRGRGRPDTRKTNHHARGEEDVAYFLGRMRIRAYVKYFGVKNLGEAEEEARKGKICADYGVGNATDIRRIKADLRAVVIEGEVAGMEELLALGEISTSSPGYLKWWNSLGKLKSYAAHCQARYRGFANNQAPSFSRLDSK